MLLQDYNDSSDCLYNPTIHLTQQELMDKFNLAFYEGQNLSKHDVLSTFNQEESSPSDEDYLVDYFLSHHSPSPVINSADSIDNDTVYFDFEKLSASTDAETTISENLLSSVDNFDLSDIELCETLSDSSLDLENLVSDLQDLDETSFNCQEAGESLPSVATISKNNVDFNNFLRNLPEDHLNFNNNNNNYQTLLNTKNEFGHLIGTRFINNNNNNNYPHEEIFHNNSLTNNQIILTQSEALLNLHDDPLLSSSSLVYPRRIRCSESDSSACEEEVSSFGRVQCQWEDCYQIYDCQTSLVKHIEKCHVEVKRGDEFTCFWENCPRKVKPFNARYKLLIHMRVHSGEKPNKCPFEGCTKAFSRLENLKIHQRSHTGERPYLCQFPTCTKSFSNSSDRAKHQRTHFDTKPYACQVSGCTKKYTDPSSLRKHVKNHTNEEQMSLKKKSNEDCFNSAFAKKFLDPNRQKAIKSETCSRVAVYASFEHSYSNLGEGRRLDSSNIKQDLKNKISQKHDKMRKSALF